MKWPGFDARFDDSGVAIEDEEDTSHFPSEARQDDAGPNHWLSSPMEEQSEFGDDDEFSSAALSRRAEMILANAKKRLNVGIDCHFERHETEADNDRSWKET